MLSPIKISSILNNPLHQRCLYISQLSIIDKYTQNRIRNIHYSCTPRYIHHQYCLHSNNLRYPVSHPPLNLITFLNQHLTLTSTSVSMSDLSRSALLSGSALLSRSACYLAAHHIITPVTNIAIICHGRPDHNHGYIHHNHDRPSSILDVSRNPLA